MGDLRLMELPDGRELAWLEVGDSEGPVVFGFHGTPSSHRSLVMDERPIEASGVRFVAVDRPGYGHSTFHHGRTLRDWACDVERLADHLGITGFSVVGVSGGGPHAVACARFLAPRLVSAGIVSGVAPPRAEAQAVRGAEALKRKVNDALLLPKCALHIERFRRRPEQMSNEMLPSMPQADAKIFKRQEIYDASIAEFRRPSRTAARATAQDSRLFGKYWGFELEDIATRVHIWHGDEDRNVPIADGELQAELIPGARFHHCPGEGHMLVVDRFEEILKTLTAQ